MEKLISLFIVIILFTVSCKEDEPTAPAEKPPTEELAEVTIGPSGGELKSDEFALIIPEGAFKTTETLTLTESNEEDPFSENTVSRQFKLDGLPDNFSKSLKLKIKHSGSISDESYILIGEEGIGANDGQSEIIYDFIPAIDSAGFLICNLHLNTDDTNIPKTISMSNNTNGKKWVLIKAVSRYFSNLGGEENKYSYRIYGPSSYISSEPAALKAFDAVYFEFLGMDFNLPDHLPSIYIANLSGDIYCKYVYRNARGDKKSKGLFAINSNKLSEIDKMNAEIAKEVSRFVSFTYDPTFPTMVEPLSQTHFWLKEAVVTIIGGLFEHHTEDDATISLDFLGNELAPLNGMHAGIHTGNSDAFTNARNHGRGMSAFLKFSSIGSIKLVLENIKKGLHPVEAINKFLSEGDAKNLSPWWIDFLKAYVLSYEDDGIFCIKHETFTNSITNENTFSINSRSDSLKDFKNSYNDLSGKLFRINVNDSEIKENEKIQFKLDHSNIDEDKVRLIMFGVVGKGSDYEKYDFIEEGSNIIVNDLNKYDPIIALVVNGNYSPPYTNKTDLELEVRLDKRKIQFKHCDIRLSVVAISDTIEGEWSPGWYTDGSFTNNIYTGTISEERQGGNASGTISVEVDDNFNVRTLDVDAYSKNEYGSSQWGFTAANVSPFENEPYLVVYNSSGSIVCSYVTSIYAKYTNPDYSYIEYKNFECEDVTCPPKSAPIY